MARSREGLPKVMSSYHRNRCCSPSFLWGNQQPRYDHFCILTNGEQRFIKMHSSIRNDTLLDDSCRCRTHWREAKQHQSDPEYIPEWKNDQSQPQCITKYISKCSATSLSNKIIVPSNEMHVEYCKNTGISCTVYNTLPSVLSTDAHTTSMCREGSKTKG